MRKCEGSLAPAVRNSPNDRRPACGECAAISSSTRPLLERAAAIPLMATLPDVR